MVTMHQDYDHIKAHAHNFVGSPAFYLDWPYVLKVLAINSLYCRRHAGIKMFAYTAPSAKDAGDTIPRRAYPWWKIDLLVRHLARHERIPWYLWLDSDAHVAQPDVLLEGLLSLPAKHRNGTTLSAHDFVLSLGRERGVFVPRVLTPCAQKCYFNSGVFLLQGGMKHAAAIKLLAAWWDAPNSGVCDRNSYVRLPWEQHCFGALTRLNSSASEMWGDLVGELDLLAINSPFGRWIRHDWGAACKQANGHMARVKWGPPQGGGKSEQEECGLGAVPHALLPLKLWQPVDAARAMVSMARTVRDFYSMKRLVSDRALRRVSR